MPIDTNMYSGTKGLDLGGAWKEGLSIREMVDAKRIRQQQMLDQDQIKAAYQAGTITNPDGTVAVDQAKTISELAKVNPQLAMAHEQEYKTKQAQTLKATLENKAMQAKMIGQALGPVKDARSWEMAKKSLMEQGLELGQWKDTPYDPTTRDFIYNSTIDAKERFEQQMREREVRAKEIEAGAKSKEAGGKITEAQSKAVGFGRRAMLADQMLEQINNDPNFNVSSMKTQILSSLPKWMGGIKDPKQQALATSKLGFIASVLRKESGAAVTPEEFGQYDQMYYPQPGDSPEIQEQKRTLRANFIDTEKLTAGSAWKDPIPFKEPPTKVATADKAAKLKRIQELEAKARGQ